jgi:hypothetical protein
MPSPAPPIPARRCPGRDKAAPAARHSDLQPQRVLHLRERLRINLIPSPCLVCRRVLTQRRMGGGRRTHGPARAFTRQRAHDLIVHMALGLCPHLIEPAEDRAEDSLAPHPGRGQRLCHRLGTANDVALLPGVSRLAPLGDDLHQGRQRRPIRRTLPACASPRVMRDERQAAGNQSPAEQRCPGERLVQQRHR